MLWKYQAPAKEKNAPESITPSMPIFRMPARSAIISPRPPYIKGMARRTAADKNAVKKPTVKISCSIVLPPYPFFLRLYQRSSSLARIRTTTTPMIILTMAAGTPSCRCMELAPTSMAA